MSEVLDEQQDRLRRRSLISRERLIELAVVVFGVSIALGAESLVQELRYQGDSRDLQKALADEVATALVFAAERQAVAPCIAERVTEVSSHLDGRVAEPLRQLPSSQGNIRYSLPQPYRTPARPWSSSVYDRALSSEAYKRVNLDRAYTYNALYTQIGQLRELNRSEFLLVTNLAPVITEGTITSEEVRADLRKDLAILDRHNALAVLLSQQLWDKVADIPFIEDSFRRGLESDPNWYPSMRAYVASYGICADVAKWDDLLSPYIASAS